MDKVDWDKVDEAAIALLSLTLFETHGAERAWKGLDWDVMDRLHKRGWIEDPKGAAKSVVFTEEGVKKAREAFEKLFSRDL